MYKDYRNGVLVNSDKEGVHLTDGEKTIHISLITWQRVLRDFTDE